MISHCVKCKCSSFSLPPLSFCDWLTSSSEFSHWSFLLCPLTTDFTLEAFGAFEEGNDLTCEKS